MRTAHALIAVGVLAAACDAAHAFDPDAYCRQIKCGTEMNAAWPWPYFCPDRAHVRAPFDVMVHNGWRRQNLLGRHHFNADSGQLTKAGELKVQWIMTQAPPHHRQIYVERSIRPDVTAYRVASTQQYASEVALQGEIPNVLETHLTSEGRPAMVVDHVNVTFQENMPVPVLKEESTGGLIEY